MSTQPKSTRKWWALALIAAAQFMVIMDTSIIGVALPPDAERSRLFPRRPDLGLQCVRHRVRRATPPRRPPVRPVRARRVFSAGWLILLIGSVVAGAAGNVAVELAGRAVQGAGAALIAPSALTLLMMLFGSTQKEMTKRCPSTRCRPPGRRYGRRVPRRRHHRIHQLALGVLPQHSHRCHRADRYSPPPDAERTGTYRVDRLPRRTRCHRRSCCRSLRHRQST